MKICILANRSMEIIDKSLRVFIKKGSVNVESSLNELERGEKMEKWKRSHFFARQQ